MHLAIRVDLGNALLHGTYFCHAQGATERLNLSVHIGLGHMVHINQRQSAHAAARKGLGSPGTDAADTYHHDMRCPNARRRVFAVQPA